MTGTLTVDGAPALLRRCQPFHQTHTFIEVDTSLGTLRFENKQAYWNGDLLACTRLDRSWGGGVRADGTAYWRGTLDLACGRVVAKLKLDCGAITPAERAALDRRGSASPR